MQQRIREIKKNINTYSFFKSDKIKQALDKKKDILIETEKNIMPYPAPFFKNKKKKVQREGLLVTWSDANILNFIKQANTNNNDRTFTFIGGKTNPKKEAGALKFPSKAICGTNTRIIDHIRRENISIEAVDTMLIDIPDEPDESMELFFADLEFILSKINTKPHIIAISSNTEKANEYLKKLSIHPQIVPLNTWKKSKTENILIETTKAEENIPSIIVSIMLAYKLKKAICYTDDNSKEEILTEAGRLGISCGTIAKNETEDKKQINIKKFLSSEIEVLVIEEGMDFPPVYNAQAIIFSDIPSAKRYTQAKNCLSPSIAKTYIFIVTNTAASNNIEQLEKKVVIKMEKKEKPDIEEITSGFLERIKNHIREENPEELEKYKKIFKKNIPLNLRSYVAGFMLKSILNTKEIKIVPMQDIFIGAGKNKKIFPSEIKNLIIKIDGVKESDIGNIRILDNYSFAEININVIDKVVQSLNGITFKGKKLTVNYGKKKL